MQIYYIIILLFHLCVSSVEAASGESEIQVRKQCIKDLDFIRTSMEENSAPYVNEEDKGFKDWFEKGYLQTKELIAGIKTNSDCYYATKYYINGFGSSHTSLRGYVKLAEKKYPGILTRKEGNRHFIIYKHPKVKYLKDVKVGDEIMHINEVPIDEYFKEYLQPFYANDKSEISLKSASVHALIIDGNPYIPTPKTVNYKNANNEIRKLELKYADLSTAPLDVVSKVQQPDISDKFKVQMISDGVWVRIPSFFPDREEMIVFGGLLSNLKKLAKEEYIIFDLRGNRGGGARWSRPIVRNLWGDGVIKSLGNKHDYNKIWEKKIRVSKENLSEFRKIRKASDSKVFADSLKNKDKFFSYKWKIFDENLNLHTNRDNSPFKAKIYVLTDNFCRSTCWNFVSEMMQMPSVTHIGAPTSIQSLYSYARKVRVPSENFDFFFPTQIRVHPSRSIGTALTPSKIYNGDFRNDLALTKWVLSIVESPEKQ